MSGSPPDWRYDAPRWRPWRQAVLLAPYGPVPAGYRWRVSLWPYPTPDETEAALLHDWRYERAGLRRQAADRAFIAALPPGALRWWARTWVARLVYRVGWWT